jgi:dGTPase
MLCRFADRIAYLTHDVADAIRADILRLSDLPSAALGRFGNGSRLWINEMIRAVVDYTIASGEVAMDPETLGIMNDLRRFMFDRVYLRPEAEAQRVRAVVVIQNLVDHLAAHPDEVPPTTTVPEADPVTSAVDYVAGMTDRYALTTHDRLFRPRLFD